MDLFRSLERNRKRKKNVERGCTDKKTEVSEQEEAKRKRRKVRVSEFSFSQSARFVLFDFQCDDDSDDDDNAQRLCLSVALPVLEKM